MEKSTREEVGSALGVGDDSVGDLDHILVRIELKGKTVSYLERAAAYGLKRVLLGICPGVFFVGVVVTRAR